MDKSRNSATDHDDERKERTSELTRPKERKKSIIGRSAQKDGRFQARINYNGILGWGLKMKCKRGQKKKKKKKKKKGEV